jgi:hypothetical protein
MCIETIQGISLYSYLYLKLAKTACFSYYLLCIFFYKNQRTGEQNRLRGGRGLAPGVGG